MSARGRPEQGRAEVDVRVAHVLCERRHDLAHRARALQQAMPAVARDPLQTATAAAARVRQALARRRAASVRP